MISGVAGQPLAFIAALIATALWFVMGPAFGHSDTWQLMVNAGTTIIAFLLVLLIQKQNRDAAGMLAKFNELLRSDDKARGSFISIEHLAHAEIASLREALVKECGLRGGRDGTSEETADSLVRRR